MIVSKTRIYSLALLLSIAGLNTLSSPALAQGAIGGNPYGYYSNGYGYRSSQSHYRPQTQPPKATKPGTNQPPASIKALTTSSAANTNNTLFRYNGGWLLPTLIANERGQDQGGRDTIRGYYEVMLDGAAIDFRNWGMPSHDVAAALAFYLLQMEAIANNRREPQITTLGIQTLANQLRTALRRDTTFQRLNDTDRQAMYEDIYLGAIKMRDDFTLASNTQEYAEAQALRKIASNEVLRLRGNPSTPSTPQRKP